MLLHSLGLRRCKTLSCGLINQNLKLLLELSSAKKSPTHKTKMYFYWNSISFRKKKKKKKEEGGKKKRERHPYLPYFLKVQLRKCVEPIRNLANVEELDLKTKQRTGCVEDKKTFQHGVNSSRARR